MPHPFPGMNPYVESRELWPSTHRLLITTLADDLSERLGGTYDVWEEEDVYIETGIRRPDVMIWSTGEADDSQADTQVAVHDRAQLVVVPIPHEVPQTHLRIVEIGTNRLVTIIEILSPANKEKDPGRRSYLDKREAIFQSAANLVEIDLLRAWRPMPFESPYENSDYRIMISRANRRPVAEMYAFDVREPIPQITIPLDPGETEPVVDLNALLQKVYDRRNFAGRIDYTREPEPPLSAEKAVWVDEIRAQHLK